MIYHIVPVRDFSVAISNNWKRQIRVSDLVDILNPLLMRCKGVCTQTNELNASFCEFRLKVGKSTELRVSGRVGVITSVVQTGVKSSGCEKSTTQLSPMNSWNLICPFVVWALKSGAILPNLSLGDPTCSDVCIFDLGW